MILFLLLMHQNVIFPINNLNTCYFRLLQNGNLNLTGMELNISMRSLLASMACDKCLTIILKKSCCLKASNTNLFNLITCSSVFDGLGITPIRASESDF